ncbi:MAG TPA: uroporphyrinogen-III synthase [Thermoanaerobaculia bacterium]|nr:uroporphyrinogen-III synthase [Thermoanaerobaculia bacterium]
MKAGFLVVRSGERPFPSSLLPGFDVVETRSHAVETLPVKPPRGSFDLAVFTSRSAVDRFLAQDGLLKTLPGRVLAVGRATAERFRSALSVDVEEGGGSVRQMLRQIPRNLAGTRVLVPHGEDSDPELTRELALRGAEVVPLLLYRKVELPYDPELDASILTLRPVAFFPTAPSAARWLLDGAGKDARARLTRTIAITLGDATRKALLERKVARVEIAQPATFEAVVRFVAELGGRPPLSR